MHGMKKIEAVSKLKDHAEAIKAMGATALYLSVRDETKESSDLDLFIDYDPTSKFNVLDPVGIKQLLEEELELPVDVTTRDGLHPMLRHDIEQTAVRVF